MLKKLTFLVIALCFTLNISAQDDKIRKSAIGLSGGWGAPYGFGIQYSYAPMQKLDITVGGGLSLSGLRGGLGVRYLFKTGQTTPFLGFNYVSTSGVEELTVDTGNGESLYDIPSNRAVFLRGGYVIKLDKIGFVFATGYGIPLSDKDAVLVGGFPDEDSQTFSDLMKLGGFELSMTIYFRF
ncbi:MAG: hypothetical protein AB8F74_20955 [Saprospiraceae bacterium]